MPITKDMLYPFLIYNSPIQYDEHITLYPVTMSDILLFQMLSKSITVRKNSIFRSKKIIKMSYLDFLIYCYNNKDLEEKYEINGLSQYYLYVIQLFQMCCKSEISINKENNYMCVNNEIITSKIFDDLRRIIIIQNDIDFDMDEFLNHDTELRLLKAENDLNSNKEHITIEDYIDSLVIGMNISEEDVMKMTIRKFWRYIKRYQIHENYTLLKTGECSGMVSFKEPIKYWMSSLDENDKYKHLKTDENELRSKVG